MLRSLVIIGFQKSYLFLHSHGHQQLVINHAYHNDVRRVPDRPFGTAAPESFSQFLNVVVPSCLVFKVKRSYDIATQRSRQA
jgi:hypothetical protein